MARNMIKCTLTGSERITNNSYLKKRLDALGVDEEYFRTHYASKPAVTALRESIVRGELAEKARHLGQTEEWVLRVASMNGKNKLFRQALANVTTSTTTDTSSLVPGEPATTPNSSGNFSGSVPQPEF